MKCFKILFFFRSNLSQGLHGYQLHHVWIIIDLFVPNVRPIHYQISVLGKSLEPVVKKTVQDERMKTTYPQEILFIIAACLSKVDRRGQDL